MMPELINSNGWDHPQIPITHRQMNQLLTQMKEKNIGVSAELQGAIAANQNINPMQYRALQQRLQRQPRISNPNASAVKEINKLALHLLDPQIDHGSVIGPFHPVETLFKLEAIAAKKEVERIEEELSCTFLNVFSGCCFSTPSQG